MDKSKDMFKSPEFVKVLACVTKSDPDLGSRLKNATKNFSAAKMSSSKEKSVGRMLESLKASIVVQELMVSNKLQKILVTACGDQLQKFNMAQAKENVEVMKKLAKVMDAAKTGGRPLL